MSEKPLILVDGSSYLYRAFHALPALHNSKGFPTGAIYGIVSMLKRLIADYKPEHMVVVFDAKGKTFRDAMYAEYKANRKAMPDELRLQIEPIHRTIRALGLSIIMLEGVEADDVIGTLATHAQQKNMHTIISTGDKDLAQLVNDKVTLINTMTNVTLDPQGVKNKFGVAPELIVDYLSLIGDSSDNIPGIEKVGPKTAVKWLEEFGSLDEIIANAEHFSGKIGENLRAALAHLPLTKKLVTIKTDVPLQFDVTNFHLQSSDKSTLIEIYKEMEFKNWLAEILTEKPEHKVDTQVNYLILDTEEKLNVYLENLSQKELFAFDIQTTHFDYMQAKIVGIAFSQEKNDAAYIPIAHDHAEKQLSIQFVLEKIKPLLENKKLKKVGHNIKYAIEVLENYNIHLEGVVFDTMMGSYVLDSVATKHDLPSLTLKYLGLRLLTYEELAGKGVKQLSFNQIDVAKAAAYAAENADMILRLYDVLWTRIQADQGLKYIFEQIEIPLLHVLSHVERQGVLIDPQKLKQQGEELQKRLLELEQEIYVIAQTEFNINSPKQLQEILFQKLKLPILQKTPTGQASTADSVLQELALDFAIAQLIIEYRSLSKLISTYTSKLVQQINPQTGRVHTSYNQSGTATGRLSSSEPNLQNIPIRTPEGRRIRQAFVAAPHHKIISADYSQIELRLMAHISEDPNLLHAFAENLDIHIATAAEVWNLPLTQVTPEMRRNAKAINFGLIYGMSAFGLTKQLGINRKEAEEYINLYFTRYPGVKNYMDNTRSLAKEKGYVETLWGRRLYLPDINASQIPRQKAAERTAINAPLQGSAADIIKLAMLKIAAWLYEEKIEAKMIMQVHDELVFEVKETEAQKIAEAIQHYMSTIVKLKVPLVVAVGIGDNWDEASSH